MTDEYRTRAHDAARQAYVGVGSLVAAVDAVLAIPRPHPPEVIEAAEWCVNNDGDCCADDFWMTLGTITRYLLPPVPPLPEITDEQVRAYCSKQGWNYREGDLRLAHDRIAAAMEIGMRFDSGGSL